MNIPMIKSVTVLYRNGRSFKLPNEACEVIIDAVGTDYKVINLAITVTDSQNESSTVTTQILQCEQLTYECYQEEDDDEDVSILPNLDQPNSFYVC